MIIPNSDKHSKDSSIFNAKMRPGHADYVGKVKYKGFNDYRGGGHFSGRLTAPLVFMGALAKLALQEKGIIVGSHIASIGKLADKKFNLLGETKEVLEALRTKVLPTLDETLAPKMETEIMAAREGQNSIGGTIECMAIGVPAGVGEPFFDSLESRLAHVLFSIPAVKGVAFGLGFGISELKGSD